MPRQAFGRNIAAILEESQVLNRNTVSSSSRMQLYDPSPESELSSVRSSGIVDGKLKWLIFCTKEEEYLEKTRNMLKVYWKL